MARTVEIYLIYMAVSFIVASGLLYCALRFLKGAPVPRERLFLAATIPAATLTVIEMVLGWAFPSAIYLWFVLCGVLAFSGSAWALARKNSDGMSGLSIRSALGIAFVAFVGVAFVASPLAEIIVLKMGLNFVSVHELQTKK